LRFAVALTRLALRAMSGFVVSGTIVCVISNLRNFLALMHRLNWVRLQVQTHRKAPSLFRVGPARCDELLCPIRATPHRSQWLGV
jgi:hypothetical protein